MSASATQGGHNYHLVAVELPFISKVCIRQVRPT